MRFLIALACLAHLSWSRTLRGDEAFASILLNTEESQQYLNGARVLSQSLCAVNSSRELVLLVEKGVNKKELQQSRFCRTTVKHMKLSKASVPLKFGHAIAHILGMTNHSKVVYLDADVIVLNNIDELFLRDVDTIAASPEIHSERFNHGVMVLRPSIMSRDRLVRHLATVGSDSSIASIMNGFFPDWFTSSPAHRLPMNMNIPAILFDIHLISANMLLQNPKIIHFWRLGKASQKPWDGMAVRRKSVTMHFLYELWFTYECCPDLTHHTNLWNQFFTTKDDADMLQSIFRMMEYAGSQRTHPPVSVLPFT